MIKNIPKSNVIKRKFNVYKRWEFSNVDLPFTLTSKGEPLYQSIYAKYYSQLDGNIFNTFGTIKNPHSFSLYRKLTDNVKVFNTQRNTIGNGIKPKSFLFTDGDGKEFIDDGYGNIVDKLFSYKLNSLNAEDGTLTIELDGQIYNLNIVSGDVQEGMFIILDDSGNADTYRFALIDFQLGVIKFIDELSEEIPVLKYGNIFYSDGIIIFNDNVNLNFNSYTLKYNSTKTIYETEVLISANAGEFNYSQNPTAIDIITSGSYLFETTEIFNVRPSQKIKIQDNYGIFQKSYFSSSINPQLSGSWNDYYDFTSSDPTGSYLTTYITTIGLYDESGDMVAVAKLPSPVKNLPDYNINFIIRLDT